MHLTIPDVILLAAVFTSMPQFHQMMGDRLRSVEQGADTVVWLALSRAAARTRSGQFFQGEQHERYSLINTHRDVLSIDVNLRRLQHCLLKVVLTNYLHCRS